MSKVTQEEMIQAVRTHATANYEKDGWDFLVECWEDTDIAEAITGATTVLDAIRRAKATVSVMNEYRAEVISTKW